MEQYYEQILSLPGVSVNSSKVYDKKSKELLGCNIFLVLDHSKIDTSRVPKSSRGTPVKRLKVGFVDQSSLENAINFAPSFVRYFPYYARTIATLNASVSGITIHIEQASDLELADNLLPSKKTKKNQPISAIQEQSNKCSSTSQLQNKSQLKSSSNNNARSLERSSSSQDRALNINTQAVPKSACNCPQDQVLKVKAESEIALSDQEHERHSKYMHMALELALKARDIGEVPVGAVIVDAFGKVIGQGYNRTIIDNDPSAHAEIMALREAGKNINNYRLIGCTMYVTLEPCCMCAMALIHARLFQVVFGAYDAKTGAAGSRFDLIHDERHNHKIEVIGGIEQDICSSTISNFFAERRKVKKAERQRAKQAQLELEQARAAALNHESTN